MEQARVRKGCVFVCRSEEGMCVCVFVYEERESGWSK